MKAWNFVVWKQMLQTVGATVVLQKYSAASMAKAGINGLFWADCWLITHLNFTHNLNFNVGFVSYNVWMQYLSISCAINQKCTSSVTMLDWKNVTSEKGTVAPPVLGGQNAHRRKDIQSGFSLWATECNTAPFAEELATTVNKKAV